MLHDGSIHVSKVVDNSHSHTNNQENASGKQVIAAGYRGFDYEQAGTIWPVILRKNDQVACEAPHPLGNVWWFAARAEN